MFKLKELLKRLGISQRRMAHAIGMSDAAFTQLVLRGTFPRRRKNEEIKSAITEYLRQAGAPEKDLSNAFSKVKGKVKGKGKGKGKLSTKKEDFMLIRRQGLFPKTKQHFNLASDPFLDDLRSYEDVFLSPDIRYVREALFATSRHGGFLAVIGESGSGKSTLRRDLLDRINREDAQVRVIEPYVLGMEDSDKVGKTLKSLHIAEAIMSAVSPLERLVSSPEGGFHQIHKTLQASARAGNSHCLIIEEAHCLPVVTLKHLKRFLELEDGFRKLLSVILLGQNELEQKLSESNHEVREVVQRCEVVTLQPMNGSLQDYLKFKLERVGADFDSIITEDGIEAIRTRLTGPSSFRSSRDSVSLVYPLAVQNMFVASMNTAAEIGAPKVTADVVKAV